MNTTLRQLLAEALGTFALVFAGTGAIIINHISNGQVTHVGIALTFGLVITVMIITLAETSGAHFNSAVTLAFTLARRFPLRKLPGYLAAQLAGALAASLLLRALFPQSPTLGQTLPAAGPWQSFWLETVLTALLVLVILRVSAAPRENRSLAPLAIGGTIALEALFAGPISGASMNPARSLAPALISGDHRTLWLYLLAPLLGATAAVPFGSLLSIPATPSKSLQTSTHSLSP